MYLADHRDDFLKKLPRGHHCKERRRNELLRLARRAFHIETADVKRHYFQKAGACGSGRRRLRGKQAAPASGGVQKSGGVKTSGGIQASHGVAKSAPTTPTKSTRCRLSSPEKVLSMSVDLHAPGAHAREEAQAVGGGQAPARALPVTMADASTQTTIPDEQMLACGDVGALADGRLRTPSWMQHFEIRASGPQAKVHSCIVSHIVDLRAFYGDIAAAEVLGASLRCLRRFESALGLTDSRGAGSGSKARGDRIANQVTAAAILGLAIKLVLSSDLTDKVPVARLWAKVAGNAHVARVKALEIQLANQWPGLA